MKKTHGKKTPGNQIEMPFVAPTLMYPAIRIPQPNGDILIRAGKPVIVGDEIGAVEAARLLGLKPRTLQTMFENGEFATAFKPGRRRNSQWRVSRAEVLERRPQ